MLCNLYKATIELCGISRQLVLHDRDNERGILKTVQSNEMYMF